MLKANAIMLLKQNRDFIFYILLHSVFHKYLLIKFCVENSYKSFKSIGSIFCNQRIIQNIPNIL